MNYIQFADRRLPLLVSSDNTVRVLFGCATVEYVEVRSRRELHTPVTLENGREGTLIAQEQGQAIVELIRYPDGTRRPLAFGEKDKLDRTSGSFRIAVRALKAHIIPLVEPKMSKDALKKGENHPHYAAEGRAKVDCIAFNEKYDRFNRCPMTGDEKVFATSGKARKRYGQEVPTFGM